MCVFVCTSAYYCGAGPLLHPPLPLVLPQLQHMMVMTGYPDFLLRPELIDREYGVSQLHRTPIPFPSSPLSPCQNPFSISLGGAFSVIVFRWSKNTSCRGGNEANTHSQINNSWREAGCRGAVKSWLMETLRGESFSISFTWSGWREEPRTDRGDL